MLRGGAAGFEASEAARQLLQKKASWLLWDFCLTNVGLGVRV